MHENVLKIEQRAKELQERVRNYNKHHTILGLDDSEWISLEPVITTMTP